MRVREWEWERVRERERERKRESVSELLLSIDMKTKVVKNVNRMSKKCLNVRQKLGTRNVRMFECSEQVV